jgi:hypothetical protein
MAIWFTQEAIEAWQLRRGPHRVVRRATRISRLKWHGSWEAFHQPLQQTEGLVGSLLELMELDLPVPDHSTLNRRARMGPGASSTWVSMPKPA